MCTINGKKILEKHRYKSHINDVGLVIALIKNELPYLKRLDIGPILTEYVVSLRFFISVFTYKPLLGTARLRQV